MVQPETILKWQSVWKRLLDMAYCDCQGVFSLSTKDTGDELIDLYTWSRRDPNFPKLTFEYVWKEYSSQRVNGVYREPRVVTELVELFVPRILFDSVGVSSFMQKCFPNCKVHFWEGP